jgi:hypothetical protein
LDITGYLEGDAIGLFDVYAPNGKLIQRSSARINGSFSKRIETSGLGNGNYILQVTLSDGRVVSGLQFTVAH